MELDSFVISAVVLLATTSIAVALFKHLGLGSVLGLLVAGIVVGPYSPGPAVTEHVEDVRHFTELGVVLLLFLIGLEMQPKRLWDLRREVFGLGSLQILISGLAIGAYVALYQDDWKIALLIGMTLALSSTAFVMQILQERGEFASHHGKTAFAILLMQDLAIVPLLALVPILSDQGALSAEVPLWQQFVIVIALLLVVYGFGRFVVPFALERLVRQSNREGFLLVVLLAVFLAAAAMHEAGLSMALGGFMMGMLLSESRFNYQIQAHIEPYKGLLMSLFFVAVGMSIDLQAISEQPWLFAQHVTVVVAIKLGVIFALALAFGLSRPGATRVAFMLAQSGEFGFVLFGSAKVLGVIDDATFVLGLGVISVSMLLTPLLVRLGDYLANRATASPPPSTEGFEFSPGETGAPVVIGGYGRMGHTVATILEHSGVPYVVFDTHPSRVAEGKGDGRPVYYGDIGDLELLEAANLNQAALVVLTIDRTDIALRAIQHIRMAYPRVPVIARARDLKDSARLQEAGATLAHPEAIESSLRMAAETLHMIGVGGEDVNALVSGVRKAGYSGVLDPRDQPDSAPAGR